ncbi:hypothetical protein BOTBODRAFT_602185 [Botryobasidium botryosum FD-172 SS1]|uniref:AMP-dependent synthetase/ligase domain-containing protein n=1 Tax=Botryobasidium botryosum (strain FD-172 SS1) TaxID=930990 RepID=A0A067MRF8_BOTB1|nr:hypothetical protein BOTBODRAFT_602185 [Botryobasidium botryosum FD-172 SS1]
MARQQHDVEAASAMEVDVPEIEWDGTATNQSIYSLTDTNTTVVPGLSRPTMSSPQPKLSMAECHSILTRPGMPFEVKTAVIGNSVQKVLKNLPASVRTFWLSHSATHANLPYVVFESDRLTYQDVRERAFHAASVFRELYGVHKGDRVSLVMRNLPELVIAFWAVHLLGAVPVLVNAWLPAETLHHCIVHTDSKLIVLDCERAELLSSRILDIKREAGATGVLVVRAHEWRGRGWDHMTNWDDAMGQYQGRDDMVWKNEVDCVPEDNAVILFTSGTTGLPKAVLGTHRAFLAMHFLMGLTQARLFLRYDMPAPVQDPTAPQPTNLLSVPLFHITGIQLLLATSSIGGRVVLMRKWDVKEAARLIIDEKVTVAGGVPSIVLDLVESTLRGKPSTIVSFLFGGAPTPAQLTEATRKAFPTAQMGQGYGSSETFGIVANFGGPDFLARPKAAGFPTAVHEVIIVDPKTQDALPSGQIGEIWVRGPTTMKEYWKDPEATAKVLTRDGRLKTGDLGSLDEEGFIYVRDRIKDIIIRGGENVDSTTVENALYADARIMECAAVGVPDARLGELVTVVAVPKNPWKGGKITEEELMGHANKSLPRFAVPVMIVVRDEPLERNPAGKILKKELREMMRDRWLQRKASSARAKL